MWAWGFNATGQLGDGTFVTRRAQPGRVGLLDQIVDIAAGPNQGVAVRSDGSVWRWGLDPRTSQPNRLPVRLVGLSDIVAVAAGYDFNLALRNDGRVFGWGENSSGQLGVGSLAFWPTPTMVPTLTAVRSIAAASASGYAIKSNGAVFGWGAGGVGDGTTTKRLTPVPIPNLNNIEQVSINGHALARTTAGEVWFWGDNSNGQGGDGTGNGVHLSPVRVPGLNQITSVAAGQSHSLAMQANGTVWAWGAGFSGQIGTSPQPWIESSPVPVPLPAGRRAVAVAAGERWSFATLG